MPKLHLLTHSFDTIDGGGLWTSTGAAGLSIDSGRLALAPPSNNVYPSLVSVTADHDLTESWMLLQLPRMPNVGTTSIGVFFEIRNNASSSQYVRWDWGNGNELYAVRSGVVVGSPVPYTAGMWIRIRMVAGTIFWDTSTDGSAWTNRGSWLEDLAFTSCEVRLYAGYWNGSDPVPSPSALIDNFNLSPSGGPTLLASSDTAALAETAQLQRTLTATDTAALAEGTTALTRATTAADTATLAETAAVSRASAGSDTATLTETAQLVVLIASVDSATLTEAGTLATATTATDGAVLSEVASLGGTEQLTAADSATLGEAADVLVTLAGTDTATLAETSQLLVILARTDTATLAEGAATISTATTAADSAVLTETASLGGHEYLTAADSATLGETADLLYAAGAVDVLALAEQADLSSSTAAADTADLTEASTLTATLSRVDVLTLIEASALTTAAAAADVLTLIESAALASLTAAVDVATLTETAQLLVTRTGTDTAVLTEVAELRVFAGELYTPGVLTTGYGPRTYMIGGQQ